ncbi:DNA-binding transcriptional regulator, MarR family [Clostridium acidisoli DSM 12555]|uniref:DNA-binding transcriptional regulator, MarR family n=1 Tax=Clostridium acidisoli DSM 12555 TaxID=1121291 RepID=A0A1W1X3S3_9CLOT|nr:MarR family transcriptional regulator [Clostridium acidisoli]SMC18576.1 DNA-binding transcriptional regulator, MarR family [Clostridium acidisoli DSM 12555]
MKSDESVLAKCLFFTSNRLSNIMRKVADEAFSNLDIASSYVYLLILVNQYNGITQSELSQKLDIAPSTSTRFVDKLISQDIVKKEYQWKTAHIYLTDKGKYICEQIDDCFKNLYKCYTDILGEDVSNNLAKEMWEVSEALAKKGY